MRALFSLGFIAITHSGVALAESGVTLEVQGTEFVVTLPDGTERRSADLVGAALQIPNGLVIRIDAVEREILPEAGDIWLHTFSIQAGSGWALLCQPDSTGRAIGFPFPGTFSEDGRYTLSHGTFSLSCISGAQAKCIRFGYAPWKQGLDGTSYIDHYNACIRMMRADYCGDQKAHTVDGTAIEIYDDLGVQRRDFSLTDMRFEAGWAPDGAICLSHVRIPTLPDPRQSDNACHTLKSRPSGKACTEEWARKHGALLFSRSK